MDALLIAGDIYDRAIPNLDAVRLFDRALHQLADLGIPTVMISGNHDSAHRLGTGSGLYAKAGVHLHTDPADAARPVLLDDEHGPVAVYGVPYLEPALARTQLDAETASQQAVLTSALDRIRADLATRPGTSSVVLAHAGADLFDGINYTALGHLHRPRSVNDRIDYSGSPLAYSFSETNHTKSLTLADLPADGAPTITRHDIPASLHLPLARLTGRIEDLLTDPAHEPHSEAWLQVTLTDTALPYEAMARLRQRFPKTLDMRHVPAGIPAQATDSPTYRERVRGRGDLDITHDFITAVRGTPPTTAEANLLQEAVDDMRVRAQEKETV